MPARKRVDVKVNYPLFMGFSARAQAVNQAKLYEETNKKLEKARKSKADDIYLVVGGRAVRVEARKAPDPPRPGKTAGSASSPRNPPTRAPVPKTNSQPNPLDNPDTPSFEAELEGFDAKVARRALQHRTSQTSLGEDRNGTIMAEARSIGPHSYVSSTAEEEDMERGTVFAPSRSIGGESLYERSGNVPDGWAEEVNEEEEEESIYLTPLEERIPADLPLPSEDNIPRHI